MKVKGLEGDYCPTDAAAFEAHRITPKKVIVLCGSVCASVFQQSGDVERLDKPLETKDEREKREWLENEKKAKTESKNRRSEERDPGEQEQHTAERHGYVNET